MSLKSNVHEIKCNSNLGNKQNHEIFDLGVESEALRGKLGKGDGK